MTGPTDDLALALELADVADEITLRHFKRPDLVVERKPDMTEVTIADRATEQAILDRLAAVRPDHSVLGEEFGVRGDSSSRWIVDPIDGTGNYVRGVPVYATLLALEHEGRLEVAVVSAPALGRRWWARRGGGAFVNGTPMHVSRIGALDEAFLSYSEGPWEDHDRRGGLGRLLAACYRQRSFGDFWQHMLVAEGALDVALEPIVALWDLAALQLIVEEAGGRFTDLDGNARPDGGSAISTNGLLHEATLRLLRSPTD